MEPIWNPYATTFIGNKVIKPFNYNHYHNHASTISTTRWQVSNHQSVSYRHTPLGYIALYQLAVHYISLLRSEAVDYCILEFVTSCHLHMNWYRRSRNSITRSLHQLENAKDWRDGLLNILSTEKCRYLWTWPTVQLSNRNRR